MNLDDIQFKIRIWLKKINEQEIVPKNIQALNFGLFESEDEYVIYLTGANKFDKTSDDWACEVDYEPKLKYLRLGDANESNDWMMILELVKQSLEYEIKTIELFSQIKHITAGFDDGELISIK